MSNTHKAVEVSAPDLAISAIEAHGGRERWNRFATLSAQLIQGWCALGYQGRRNRLSACREALRLRRPQVRESVQLGFFALQSKQIS
jgi:hypothetical protein